MTELELVYSIIETLNANEYNNDNKVTERVVRNYLYAYRGDFLKKHYSDGYEITDECFQLVELSFEPKGLIEYQANAGVGVMEFSLRQGFFMEKNGIRIPVIGANEYALIAEEDLPVAKKLGTLVTLKFQQSLLSCIKSNSEKGVLFNTFKEEASLKKVTADLYAVLTDPSKGKGYDWKTSVFPFPAERIAELKKEILRVEFGITSQVKSDEVQNGRVDNIRYHENTNLEQ